MITSTKNRQVAAAARLKKRALRDKEGRFLVESARVAVEALEAGAVEILYHVPDDHGRADPIVERAAAAGVTVQPVSEKVMSHLTSTVTPQRVVAVARYVDAGLDDLSHHAMLVPVLCSVRDPGNAGTILRSADAAGADAVVFTTHSVDVYNPKTVRASAGSLFHLPVVRGVTAEETVEAMRGRGAQILAAAADGEVRLQEADLSHPTAVLLGNEAWGLDSKLRALADRSVRIPIRGEAESLNLAVAAALVMFESARARDGVGEGALGRIAELVVAGAHDIRSPLTAVTGFVSTLSASWDRLEDERKRGIVAGMAMDGHRIGAQIRLLVDAVGLEAGSTLKPAGHREDVAEAARWIADLFRGGTELPEVAVEGSGEVAVERDRLRALLLALCEGAAWWATEGAITVWVRGEDGGAAIDVSRGGEGPTPEQAAGILAGPESGGKVGLYAAGLIAKALGGSVTAEGGDGIRFRLRLP